MSTQLTDADLARLEELAGKATPGPWETVMDFGVGCPSGDGPVPLKVCMADEKNDARYIAAACNATPALVAEVRRLRARVEALEWLVECIDNYEWNSNRSGWFVAQGVAKEAKATMQAAREAMK